MLRQLKSLLPTLIEQTEVEIEALLPKLTEAFRGVVFTLGSSTIAISESRNRILKSGPFLQTFVVIRNAHTSNYNIKAAAVQARTSNHFRTLHFLQRQFDLKLFPAILKLIDIAVEKAAHLTVTTVPDDPDHWEDHSKNSI
jgi:hypothetical protein